MCGACFTRDRHVKRIREARGYTIRVAAAGVAKARAGSALSNALKQVDHGVGNLGAEDLARSGAELVEHDAVGVLDAQDDDGLGVEALVAKGGVGSNKLINTHVDGTEGY